MNRTKKQLLSQLVKRVPRKTKNAPQPYVYRGERTIHVTQTSKDGQVKTYVDGVEVSGIVNEKGEKLL